MKFDLLVCFLVWVVPARRRYTLDSNVYVHVFCIFWWFCWTLQGDSVWLHAHASWKEHPLPHSHPHRKSKQNKATNLRNTTTIKPTKTKYKVKPTQSNTNVGVNYHLYMIKRGKIDKTEINVGVIQRNCKPWSWGSL